MESESKPLGYIDLPDGAKAIYPMNDIFLNFTFEHPEHWEALRLTVNILVEAYQLIMPDATIKPIKGNVKVRTQFKYLMKMDSKAIRVQDLEVTENDEGKTYVEFQNRNSISKPIEFRAVEYFGLGISHSKGKTANQIWLLAEDVDVILKGKPFARYTLKDEVTGEIHPGDSGILYVSLTQLSKENSRAGELARFLLGKEEEPEDESVKKIAAAFKGSFASFKENKEAVQVMTLLERALDEGLTEGMAKGEAVGLEKAIRIAIQKNVPFDIIEAMAQEANIPPKRLDELRALATA